MDFMKFANSKMWNRPQKLNNPEDLVGTLSECIFFVEQLQKRIEINQEKKLNALRKNVSNTSLVVAEDKCSDERPYFLPEDGQTFPTFDQCMQATLDRSVFRRDSACGNFCIFT